MDALSQDKVEFIISVAREVAEESDAIIDEELAENSEPQHYCELDMAAQASATRREDHANNSNYQELKSIIENMNEEEQNELVALMWLGRGSYGNSEWANAVENARDVHNNHTAQYLINIPILADYLEEGLSIIAED